MSILFFLFLFLFQGRGTYGTEVAESEEEQEKHLFRCQTEGNIFVGEEILGFGQSSLIPEATWLLDAGNMIWIWLGKLSATKSLKQCVEDAMIFLYSHPAGRDRNTTISIIKQGMVYRVIRIKFNIKLVIIKVAYISKRDGTANVYRTF